MDNMIRVYEKVLSQEFCQKLIDKFEASDNKTIWNDYRKFSDTLLLENPEYWKDEIPVCLDAFTQIIEKYKNDLPWPDQHKKLFPKEYTLEGIKLKKYSPNDIDEFPWHVDVTTGETCLRFLAFFIYLDDNDAGELLPEITTKPPPNDLDNMVLPLSLLLESFTLPLRASDAEIILDNLCVEKALAISSVGITTNIGAGSCAI